MIETEKIETEKKHDGNIRGTEYEHHQSITIT